MSQPWLKKKDIEINFSGGDISSEGGLLLLREADRRLKLTNKLKGESFSFVGYAFYRRRSLKGKWRPYSIPKMDARTSLLAKLKEVFRVFRSQPITRIIEIINPIIRGWVNYSRYGDSSLNIS